MSGGWACPAPSHRPAWRVLHRNGHYSAFNGYRWTPSAYSRLRCLICFRSWRTKAAYVARIPTISPQEAR